MSLKFWNYNLVTQDQTVITPSTENALFPASNLKDPRVTKSYRSTGASCTVVFDFVTTEDVDSVLLVPHSRNGWGLNTPITIEANATNTWGAPAFSTTLVSGDLDQEHGIAIKEFSTQSYRYWRLSFTGTSYVEVGKLFIGKLLEIGTNARSMDYGWQFLDDDLSVVAQNRYNQKFVDETISQKRMVFDVNLMDRDELDDMLQMYDYNRRSIPFWMHVEAPAIINNTNRLAGLFFFESMPVIVNPAHALWNTSWTISEAR